MRYVKPTFWTDSRMVRLSRDARLFYIGTWNFAMCDKGHLEDDPVQLKMQIFPADNIDVEPLMDELVALGRLVRITDGETTWLQIGKLEPHQKTDPRWTPRCPACKAPENLSETQESLGGALTSEDDPSEPPMGDEDGETLPNSPQEGRGGEGRGEKTPVVPFGENEPADESKAGARKRARQLPDDWTPNDDHLALAREMRVDPAAELAKFRDHAIANGRTLKDWNAGFRNWLRNAKPSNVRPLPATDPDKPKPKPREIDPDAPFQPQPRRFGEENRLR